MASRFPDAPPQIKALPLDKRGYPVPWFVHWEGDEPDFRVIGHDKLRKAIAGACWICGKPVGRMKAFVIGPMCAVNRVSSEPPSHLDCAVFAAKSCPFLAHPMAKRREDGPLGSMADGKPVGGTSIPRNPGVALVWATLRYKVSGDGRGGILFDVGRPERTLWFAHGREATRAEVMASIESGLPILQEMAERESISAVEELKMMTERALKLLPAV